MASPGEPARIRVVDTLRGVAALAVLWNHLATGLADYPTSPAVRAAGEYGQLGVPIFFVISGFVIPYALRASGYGLRSYGRFLLKRIIRIDLPCYASVAIIVALSLLTTPTRFETAPRYITAAQVLLHLGYLNYLAGYQFLNGVLWSLAIEFQYYLFIALIFPLLADRRPLAHLYPFALMALLAWLAPDRQLLFHYGFLFLLGMTTFQFVDGLLPRRAYLALLALAGAGAVFTVESAAALVGIATALVIAFARPTSTPLAFFGAVSYSLYLIHVPVALRVMRALGRYGEGAAWQWAAMFAGGAASIAAAWLLWRLVERPSQRWASSIRYRAPVEARAAKSAAD